MVREITPEVILKQRTGIMGVAVVAMFLYFSHFSSMPEWLGLGYNLLTVSFDIFVLLAGLDSYYSIYKHTNGQFYKAKLRRIYPAYLLMFAVNAFVVVQKWGHSFEYFYARYSLYAYFFKGNEYMWFAGVMLFLYLITPIVFDILDKDKTAPYFVLFGLIIAATFAIEWFVGNEIILHLNRTLLIRIPVYMLGLYLGKWQETKPEKTIKLNFGLFVILIMLLAAAVLNMLVVYPCSAAVQGYLHMLLAYVLCIYQAAIFKKEKSSFFSMLGDISWECYVYIEQAIQLMYLYVGGLTTMDMNIDASIITVVVALITRKLFKLLTERPD